MPFLRQLYDLRVERGITLGRRTDGSASFVKRIYQVLLFLCLVVEVAGELLGIIEAVWIKVILGSLYAVVRAVAALGRGIRFV